MLVLFISYVDFAAANSGSGMRPQKMYEAFLAEGHQVKLLSGQQGNFSGRKTRQRAVAETSAWLDSHRPDLCYIESPVYPILWEFDRQLIRKIRRMGVPIGYFYRDFYRKFPDQFPRRKDPVGRAKELYLDVMQRRTDRVLRCADIVYFPSAEAFSLFSFRDMRTLPPGGEDHLEGCRPEERRCVYVGGMVQHYGGEMMLRAFALLNAGEKRYPLTLVCRKNEWAQIPDALKNGDWLEVRHASGDELIPLLSKASAGLLIGNTENEYNNYTVSIKLFEYMGYGLPVVYVKNPPLTRIVGEADFGIGTEYTPESFADGVRALFERKEAYGRYRENARRALLENNLWVHRVRQVVRELTGREE